MRAKNKTRFDCYPILMDAYREHQKVRYKQSLNLLKKWLPKMKTLGPWDAQLAYAYGLIGNNLVLLNRSDESIPFFRKASVINKHMKLEKVLHDLWWLGHAYELKRNWKRAAAVYKEIATIAPLVGQKESGWSCQSLGMAAGCLWLAKEFDQALSLFQSAVKGAEKDCVSLVTVAAIAERIFHFRKESDRKSRRSKLYKLWMRLNERVSKLLEKLETPATARKNVTEKFFGKVIDDPYRWLEDTRSSAVKEWIDSQNEVSDLYLNSIPGRAELLDSLHRIGPSEQLKIRWKRGDYLFSSDRPLTQLFRSTFLKRAPKLVLDSSKLSDDIVIQNVSISPNGKYVAYWLATKGSDWNTIRVRNIDSGKDITGILKDARAASLAWKGDSAGFYYTAHSRSNDYTEIRFHKLGTSQSKDKRIHRVEKRDVYAGVNLVNNEKHLLVDLTSTRRNIYSNYLIDLRSLKTIPVAAEQESHYAYIGQNNEKLFFKTNKNASMERVVSVNLSELQSRQANARKLRFSEVIRERKESLKTAFAWGDYIVCVYSTRSGDLIRRYLKNKQLKTVAMPLGLAIVDFCFVGFPSVEIIAEGYISPQTLYKFNLETGEFGEFAREQRAFDTNEYVIEENFARSKDGTKIPYYIRYKKGIKFDGSNPTIISGYGGFSRALSPSLNSYDLLWNSLGGIAVDTVLRGDSGLGTAFRKDGTRETKQKTFDDLIAVAETLIRKKYTSPKKLGIAGGSNGGLLVAAVLTQRPDLIGAVQCNSALLDMLRFHRFGTEKHYAAEYCSATNQKHYEILRAYSPLHNLPKRAYPPVLIDTGSHDDRVNPAHSYKFAAALQNVQTANAPILLKVEMNVGHGFVRTSMRHFDRFCFFAYQLGLVPSCFQDC